ncbi:MAG: PEGA domain-containing protein [Myxococcales bacterium]|nr:PEGA domain-containing protein [Myxococcales bacterium]
MSRVFSAGVVAAMALVVQGACTSTADVPPAKEPVPTLSMPDEGGRPKVHKGAIVIESSPANLVALLNGKKVGNTPLTVDDLSAGNYDVTFKDEANGDVTMTVELAEGEYRTVRHNVVPRATE